MERFLKQTVYFDSTIPSYLLTWNCNHLANANKSQHLRIVNTRLNLPIPEIITPLELFTEEKDDK